MEKKSKFVKFVNQKYNNDETMKLNMEQEKK